MAEYVAPGLITLVGVFLALYLKSVGKRVDDVKKESEKAHTAIGENINRLRTEVREDIKELRQDVGKLREEMTGLTGRVGRIEGILEGQDKT